MSSIIISNILKNLHHIKQNLLKKENIYLAIFILILFSFDRFSKNQVINNYSDDIIFINDYINLDLIWNTGIGFGLLSTNSSMIYNFISALIFIVIAGLVVYTINLNKVDRIIFGFIIGGALGNFYDRLIFSGVPDFIDIHYNNFHWFTFNAADIFISLGIIAFLLRSFSIKN